MSSSLQILAGLVAGLVLGIAIATVQEPSLLALVAIVEPIGALWLNAIRMTVVPLVVSLLVVAIATGAGLDTARRIGGGTIALFVAFIAASSAFAAFVAPPALALFGEHLSAAAGQQPGPAADALEIDLPPFRDWLVGLIPPNPIEAAADGALLPLVIFAVIMGVALTRVDGARERMVPLFRIVADAMLVVVGWIIAVAPIGIFALVLPLAAEAGPAMAGVLGYGVVVMCALVVVALLALYPVGVLFGRVPLLRFARACGPAQAVAFGTRSSLASLPPLIKGASEVLGLGSSVTGLVLPLAVSIFKFATPIARITGTLFIAQFYGMNLGAAEILAISAAIGGLSFYAPGIPSGTLFIIAPVYMAFGLPLEGIGILIALDAVVDAFTTVANVTANMTVAVIIGRGGTSKRAGEPDGAVEMPPAPLASGTPSGV